jgi:hypothetical protein
MIAHEGDRLLAAGAALDDLSPDERAAFESHAATCADCRTLELELGSVLADLALAAPERKPPADLFAGIRLAMDAEDSRSIPTAFRGSSAWDAPMDDTGATTVTPVAAFAASADPEPSNVVSIAAARTSRRIAYAAVGLAAAFGLVAVGLGARTAGMQDDLDRSTAQVAALQAQTANQGGVVAAAMNPQHVTVALHAEPLAPQASATVVFVPGSTTAYLVAQNLPATPAGHGYQLWYADDAGVHPLQTVAFDGTGAFVAPLAVDLAKSKAVMVTLEETGGAQGEPGPQVVFGEV